MERPVASSQRQVIIDLADAGTGTGTGTGAGTESFAASASGGSLGTALLPLFALAAALTAATCVGSLIVQWLRKPEGGTSLAVTDPETAGLLSVGFVSGGASARWLPATVMLLAGSGVIAIRDARGVQDGEEGRAQDIHLAYDGEYPLTVGADAEFGDITDDTVRAMLTPGLSGGSLTLARGSSVDLDRVVIDNRPLMSVTRSGFRDAADWYREPRPVGRFRAATIAGVLGIVLGIISLGLRDESTNSISWSAIGIAALALGLRALLPRWIPLNAAGLQLRERANQLREVVASTDVASVATGEKLLPWAVMFDEASVVRAFAEVTERSGAAPAWYRSAERFSAQRLASCIALISAQLSQPIRVGGGVLQRNEDSRFGVPLTGDTRWWWAGGYFASDGGAGIAGYGDGVFGDGGGLGGGGFDGGGGGFDGGGGGGDGGGGF